MRETSEPTPETICHPEIGRTTPERLTVDNCILKVEVGIKCPGCGLDDRVNVSAMNEDRQAVFEIAKRCIVFRIEFPRREWSMISKK